MEQSGIEVVDWIRSNPYLLMQQFNPKTGVVRVLKLTEKQYKIIHMPHTNYEVMII